MREKMRQHLGGKHRDQFDIKAAEGGISDIVFIAHYLVLNYATQEPRLTRRSDNVGIFEQMANYNRISAEEEPGLTQADVTMRDAIQHLALQEQSGAVGLDAFVAEREQVRRSSVSYTQQTLPTKRIV